MLLGRLARSVAALILACLGLSSDGPSLTPPERGPAQTPELASRRRKPVALALVDEGRILYVANSVGGSISVIDAGARRVVAEHEIGGSPSDLVAMPDGRRLLATDEAGSQLLLLERRANDLAVRQRVAVAHGPVSIRVSRDGELASVASLWSRRLTIVRTSTVQEQARNPILAVAGTIDLPFAPRHQLLIDRTGKLIVADAFGGNLAVVDLRRRTLDSVRRLPAHNIGGLALDADGGRVLVTHQFLNHLAHTTADDIHWGFLLTNSVRSLRLTDLLDPAADLTPGSRLVHLGEPGAGAGDPAGLAVLAGDRVVVALAGVGQLTLGPVRDPAAWRIAAGRRPTAVATSPDGSRAYVADSLGDSVVVIDLRSESRIATIPLGPRPEPGLVERGERLFYDARLSHEGWLSCHSCHTDGHTNNLRADTLGDGSFGAPKRTPSLLGLAPTAPYGWDGGVGTLEEQVRKSLKTTMLGQPPSDESVAALSAYLGSLSPPRPPLDTSAGADGAAIDRGRSAFRRLHCASCHRPPAYTSTREYDVGLADESGRTRFNPPPLLGVSQRDAYLHDGRARTLAEAITLHAPTGDAGLSDCDVADLVAFLRCL
jgi:YVTN family beta-propeller protein